MSNVIDAKGIFEARHIQINAQRVADKILAQQKYHAEKFWQSLLEEKIESGDWRKSNEHRDL